MLTFCLNIKKQALIGGKYDFTFIPDNHILNILWKKYWSLKAVKAYIEWFKKPQRFGY